MTHALKKDCLLRVDFGFLSQSNSPARWFQDYLRAVEKINTVVDRSHPDNSGVSPEVREGWVEYQFDNRSTMLETMDRLEKALMDNDIDSLEPVIKHYTQIQAQMDSRLG